LRAVKPGTTRSLLSPMQRALVYGAYIAKQLAKAGFSKIEPISGTTLYAAAKKFEKQNDFKQLKATMGFIGDCMTGTGQTPFLSAVEPAGKDQGKEPPSSGLSLIWD